MVCLVIELKRVIWEHELIQDNTNDTARSLCGIIRGLAVNGDGKTQLFIPWEIRIDYFNSNSSLHLLTQ